MSVMPTESPSWGFVQWSLTALTTCLASAGGFLWRFALRLEKLESAGSRQKADLETTRDAVDAALLRLAERFAHMHDDHFRLREALSALPGRGDLRDLEDRLVERLESLAARFDRALDR